MKALASMKSSRRPNPPKTAGSSGSGDSEMDFDAIMDIKRQPAWDEDAIKEEKVKRRWGSNRSNEAKKSAIMSRGKQRQKDLGESATNLLDDQSVDIEGHHDMQEDSTPRLELDFYDSSASLVSHEMVSADISEVCSNSSLAPSELSPRPSPSGNLVRTPSQTSIVTESTQRGGTGDDIGLKQRKTKLEKIQELAQINKQLRASTKLLKQDLETKEDRLKELESFNLHPTGERNRPYSEGDQKHVEAFLALTAATKKQQETIVAHQAKFDKTKKELDKAQKEIKHIKKEYIRQTNELVRLEKEFDANQSEISGLRKELSQALQQIDSLEEERETDRSQVLRLTRELTHIKSGDVDTSDDTFVLKEKLERCELELEQKERAIESQCIEVESQVEHILHLETELERALATVARLEDERDRSLDDVAKENEELHNLSESNLDISLDEQEKVLQMNATLLALQELEVSRRKLNSELAEARQQIVTLEHEKTAVQSDVSGTSDETEKINLVNNTLLALRELEESRSKLNSELEGTQQQVEQLHQENVAILKANEALMLAQKEYHNDTNELQSKLDLVTTELEAAKVRNTTLEAEHNDILATIELQMNALRYNLNEVDGALQEANGRNRALAEMNHILLAEKISLEEANHGLHEKSREKQALTESEVAKMNAELESARNSTAAAQLLQEQAEAAAAKEIMTLQAEIQRLQNRIAVAELLSSKRTLEAEHLRRRVVDVEQGKTAIDRDRDGSGAQAETGLSIDSFRDGASSQGIQEDLDYDQKEIDDLRKLNDQLEAEIIRLVNENDEWRIAHDEPSVQTKLSGFASENNEEILREISDLRYFNAQMENEISQLIAERDRWKEAAETAEYGASDVGAILAFGERMQPNIEEDDESLDSDDGDDNDELQSVQSGQAILLQKAAERKRKENAIATGKGWRSSLMGLSILHSSSHQLRPGGEASSVDGSNTIDPGDKDQVIAELQRINTSHEKTINALKSDIVRLNSGYKDEAYLNKKKLEALLQENAAYEIKTLALENELRRLENANGDSSPSDQKIRLLEEKVKELERERDETRLRMLAIFKSET